MSDALHAAAAERVHSDGQRYTAQRRAIVEVLEDAPQPLTIPQLLALQPGLAQSSAYRNLAVLERAEVVHRIVTADGFGRFELAEDLTHHHHHLICATCGEVTDFEVSEAMEHDLESALARVAKRAGFTVRNHRLDLVGTCAACS
jgi:Fe2+ or Zn2+ uptake regulation protein